jgi:hypothetical protein
MCVGKIFVVTMPPTRQQRPRALPLLGPIERYFASQIRHEPSRRREGVASMPCRNANLRRLTRWVWPPPLSQGAAMAAVTAIPPLFHLCRPGDKPSFTWKGPSGHAPLIVRLCQPGLSATTGADNYLEEEISGLSLGNWWGTFELDPR